MARSPRELARARVPRRAPAGRSAARNPYPLERAGGIPKYLQVAEHVIQDLKSGRLRKGDQLPSINEASERAGLSRDTIVKAYARLEELRLLEPVHGKGYYLRADAVDLRLRTLVVFDTLNAYKERLFAGLVDGVGQRAELDVWFHHFNPAFIRKLLADARGKYDRYVVMPFVGSGARDALAALEPDRLLVLDIFTEVPGEGTNWLVQNFDQELERALDAGAERFRRYERLIYVDRPGKHNPEAIPGAAARFATKHGLAYDSVPGVDEAAIQVGSAYLVIEDDDLVTLVRWCKRTGRQLGRDVGVVSYNDTPLKEVVANGITVVSTDFYAMGVRAAQHVLEPAPLQAVNPTRMILRSSL